MNIKIKYAMNPIMLFFFSLLSLTFMGCQEDEIVEPVNNNIDLPDVSAYPIVSTNQSKSYSNNAEISKPAVDVP